MRAVVARRAWRSPRPRRQHRRAPVRGPDAPALVATRTPARGSAGGSRRRPSGGGCGSGARLEVPSRVSSSIGYEGGALRLEGECPRPRLGHVVEHTGSRAEQQGRRGEMPGLERVPPMSALSTRGSSRLNTPMRSRRRSRRKGSSGGRRSPDSSAGSGSSAGSTCSWTAPNSRRRGRSRTASRAAIAS